MTQDNHDAAGSQSAAGKDGELRLAGMPLRRFIFVAALIGVGLTILLVRHGVVSHWFVRQWWPLALVALGVWIAIASRR
ncbi:hypothetical protein [Verminephrobacter aporrectodeae]|uniref:hypothetical protein n=1 Tax=Verminephrobacter aporrectodeae TaxID=1110389 RepID=UPI002243E6C8|nr:hypothetical protein [Verminephrobacter aporrectodeae]MCW8173946.1 hypothetical protein [Verminephrobacter aporrectodeae subsp. tuberculatae]MCW8202055.1 hypothetical protein [Verminephrobacter aporrectodeae subsp. tuberculatae]